VKRHHRCIQIHCVCIGIRAYVSVFVRVCCKVWIYEHYTPCWAENLCFLDGRPWLYINLQSCADSDSLLWTLLQISPRSHVVPFSGKYSTKCSQVMQNPARSTQVVESQRPHPSEILNSLIFMTRTNTSQGTILSLQIESSRKQRFITFEKIQSMSSASRLLGGVSKKKTNTP